MHRAMSSDRHAQRESILRRPAVVVGVLASVAFLASALASWQAALRPSPISDVAAYWRAGAWLLHGRVDDLYPLTTFPGGTTGGSFKGVANPPHSAVLFAPLGAMSLPGASVAFALVNVAALVATLAIANALLRRRAVSTDQRIAVLAVTASSIPVAVTIANGGLSLIVTALVLALVLADVDDRPILGGVALAMLTIKPQFALLPAVFLLARRRYRIVGIGAGLAVAAVALSVPFVGVRAWTTYPDFLRRYTDQLDIFDRSQTGELWLPRQMVNLRGLALRALGADRYQLVNAIGVVAVLIGVALVVVVARLSMHQPNLAAQAWMSVLALTTVTSQHVNVGDAVLLLVAVALLLDGSATANWSFARTLPLLALLWFGFLFGNPSRSTPLLPWSALAALLVVGLMLRATFSPKRDLVGRRFPSGVSAEVRP